jgi:plasmid stabilization system protein ParE
MTYALFEHESARHDILAIVDRISDDNPAAAAAVYEAYEHSLKLLKTTPDLGRPYRSPNPRLSHIRVCPIQRFRNCLIFYRHIGGTVEVLHIWHGVRNTHHCSPQPFLDLVRARASIAVRR